MLNDTEIQNIIKDFISILKLNDDDSKKDFGLAMKTESQKKIFYVYKNSKNHIIAKPRYGKQKNGEGKARPQTVKTGLKEYFLNGTIDPNHSSYNIAIKKYLKKEYFIIHPDEISKNLLEGSKKEVIVNSYERNFVARKKCCTDPSLSAHLSR